jgi:DNA-binding NarL/FixJ family response regulator
VADDDPAFRSQLEELLAANVPNLEIVASVGDGHEAVAAALEHHPMLVVIDYTMPGPNGAHAAAVIQQALPESRVIVVSGRPRAELDDLPPGVAFVRKGAEMERDLAAALAQR